MIEKWPGTEIEAVGSLGSTNKKMTHACHVNFGRGVIHDIHDGT